jgi:ferritin-like metal-binding protein YciE
MPVKTPRELLKHELGDILYAEKQILKAIRPMIRETSDPEMKARLEQHEQETEAQVGNIERAFEAIGEKARAQKCPGILGIIEEKKEFKEEEEPSKAMLEAFNLGAGLRVEHYEIAAYRSAMTLAKALGLRDVAALLKENLDQELAMAKFIESAAPAALQKVMAMVEQEQMKEEAKAARSASKSAGKSAAKSASARA